MTLPVEIWSVAGVRSIDRNAVEVAGIDGYRLMTRAARAALAAARAAWPGAGRWQVFCGAGNNGGDGYVLARLAAEQGIAVRVSAVAPPERLDGDAARACRDYLAAGGKVQAFSDRKGEAGAPDPSAELYVDAILGSGLSRPLEGDYAAAVDALNRLSAPVLALDVPSGLSGDSGAVMGSAVRAALTVTFVGLKTGLFLGRGPDCVGQLVFADLDIPADCRANLEPVLRRINGNCLRALLPPRRRGAHKGDFGHLLIVGGGRGMPGAARLAATAALRSGAGRVTVAAAPESVSAIVAGIPEAMCHPVDAAADLEPLLERASTLAVGPGLGTGEWARGLLQAAVDADLPAVMDADALNLLAGSGRRHDDWVLTPHPGEAGRLLGCTSSEVQEDRLHAVAELAARYGGTAVLKGANTLISSSAGTPTICTEGNPGMASAGMGDVLTGIVGGLLAQGLAPEQAACAGVAIHARAGDAAAGTQPRGLLAGDLMAEIRRCVNP